MNRALAKLIGLSLKSSIRRTFRGAKTVRGAFLVLFTLGVLALMIVPGVAGALALRSSPGMPPFVSWLEPYLPLGILGFCLLMIFGPAGEMAISFTPAEIDFLFAGPFTRRELLIYKLAKTVMAAAILALVLSAACLIYFRLWLAAFVGVFLTVQFMQLLTLSVALAGQIVAEHAYTRGRKAALWAVAALVSVGLLQMLWQTPILNIPGLALAFRGTWSGRIVLAPFEVLSAAMLAGHYFPELLCWGAGAAAMDLALAVLVIKLDADYVEGAVVASQKLYERIQKVREGGGFALPVSERSARLRVPTLPWLWGAGPIAWRQLMGVLRTSRMLVIMFLGMGAAFLIAALLIPRDSAARAQFATFGLGGLAYMTFIFTMQLPWAFRGDIDYMPVLKTLPMPAVALAAGELAGTVLLLAAIQFTLLAGLLAVGANPLAIGFAAAFAVPFDFMMVGVGNAIFLVYPVRVARGGAADLQLFGRAMLFFMLQMLILIPALGIPAAAGGIAFFLSGYHWPVFAAVSWLLLTAEVPVVLLALAWVFERFDPSLDSPA
jgi:Putative ABC exporter